MKVDFPIISADSHITEAPNTYLDYIDPKYAATAPRVVETEDKGDLYVIDGMKRTIPMGLVAAAGVDPMKLNTRARYSEIHRRSESVTSRRPDLCCSTSCMPSRVSAGISTPGAIVTTSW